MNTKERERICALLDSVEKEERRRNISSENVRSARRLLFEDSEDEDVLIRDEVDEDEIDIVTHSDHDTASEVEDEPDISEQFNLENLEEPMDLDVPIPPLTVTRELPPQIAEERIEVEYESYVYEPLNIQRLEEPTDLDEPILAPADFQETPPQIAEKTPPNEPPVRRGRGRGRGGRGRGQDEFGRDRLGGGIRARGGQGRGNRGRGRGQIELSEYTPDGLCYLGKDQKTQWKINKTDIRGRTSARNIVTRLPGPKGEAKTVKTPLQSFLLFFPDEQIELIVQYTNKYIDSVQANYSRERDARPTNILEMKAVIGLLYLAGLLKSSHQNLSDLWRTDGTGVEMFRCVMSEIRFRFLLRALRFDDIDHRQARLQVDKLAKVRLIFDAFVEKCKSHFSPSEYVTVDEMLDSFRGKCPFRQYMPQKPAKYGIKIFALCCARTYYTVKLEIYAGKQPEGPFQQSNKVIDVVDRMVQPVVNTGRNVTFDNWFMSIPMAEHLRDDYRLTVVGTVRRDKPKLPLVFKNTKELPVNSSVFAFRENMTAVMYKPKPNKTVSLLSTMHDSPEIDHSTGDASKPEILTFYNLTKGGVDVVDGMKNLYSVSRISQRWPLTIFFSLLNIGAINATVVLNSNLQQPMKRKQFLKDLSWALCSDFAKYRATLQQTPKEIKLSIDRILKIRGEATVQEARQLVRVAPNVIGRCSFCDSKKNRKTKTQCSECNHYICEEHTITVCVSCKERGDADEVDNGDNV